MLPNFIIIGAQKSGTTFLQHCLHEHPQIFISKNEVVFFEDPHFKSHKLEDLEKLFKDASPKQLLGIKRPNYLGRPECPKRIKKILPDAKLIVILRNPIDRAISAYFHNIKLNLIPQIPPDDGLKKIFLEGEIKGHPRSSWVRKHGYYYKHLKRYLKYFDKKQILILYYDDLKRSPLKTIKKCYKFLGVDSNFNPKKINTHPQKGVYSTYRLFIKRLENRIMLSMDVMNRGVEEKENSLIDYSLIVMLEIIDKLLILLGINKDYVKIQPSTRKIIADVYKADILNLEKLTKKNLSHWK
jgi:hypothetical protein